VAALSRLDVGAIVVVGDRGASERAGFVAQPGRVDFVQPPPTAEPVEIAAIRWATEACIAGRARGLVTGPIHKARAAAGGFAFSGHTDFLAHLCASPSPVMAFVGGEVRVALVTVHVPLRDVPALITEAAVLHTLRVANGALRTHLGLPAPRLAVCGLNPHAGEGGLLGDEEQLAIGPAVWRAQQEGILAFGPVSAEHAFMHPGDADMIVAMYHDQGLAPLKRVDFGRSVNWTLGLPIVRTSVDHGTADDLVGTGRASAASMEAAIRLADRLTRSPTEAQAVR
jgi:4-hydroxythreonine-4-phosphate dehydrogenase